MFPATFLQKRKRPDLAREREKGKQAWRVSGFMSMEKQRSMKRKSWSAFSVLFLVPGQEMASGGEPKRGKVSCFISPRQHSRKNSRHG